jgi:hypothetical protein
MKLNIFNINISIYTIGCIILIIILALILLYFSVIEEHYNNYIPPSKTGTSVAPEYLYPYRDLFCEQNMMEKSYIPSQCCTSPDKCNNDQVCRCVDPSTGFCTICYDPIKLTKNNNDLDHLYTKIF